MRRRADSTPHGASSEEATLEYLWHIAAFITDTLIQKVEIDEQQPTNRFPIWKLIGEELGTRAPSSDALERCMNEVLTQHLDSYWETADKSIHTPIAAMRTILLNANSGFAAKNEPPTPSTPHRRHETLSHLSDRSRAILIANDERTAMIAHLLASAEGDLSNAALPSLLEGVSRINEELMSKLRELAGRGTRDTSSSAWAPTSSSTRADYFSSSSARSSSSSCGSSSSTWAPSSSSDYNVFLSAPSSCRDSNISSGAPSSSSSTPSKARHTTSVAYPSSALTASSSIFNDDTERVCVKKRGERCYTS